ncbi:MAG: PE-PPE domain-containing protein [Mycobacterium sp.]
MKRLFAAVVAVSVVGASGGLGTGVASAQPNPFEPAPRPSPVGEAATADVVYALGGARAPGIPWYDYTNRAGADYFPKAKRDLVDYPAGAPFSWVPTIFSPVGGQDRMSIGQAADVATNNLDAALRRNGDTPAAVVGLSQGTLGLADEQVRLAHDPKAPPADQLTFTQIGNPIGHHGFGKSFLTGIFAPGDYIPLIDYTVPADVDSQYDTNKVVATYDGLADYPDRADNLLAGANALAASAIVHTPAAFTGPGDVPPQNVKTVVNSRGATETTYLIPVKSLPLTLPLRYLGVAPGDVDALDAILRPQIDSGYSRYDNPLNRPVSVDPAHGMDPIAILDPETRGAIESAFATVREFMPPA